MTGAIRVLIVDDEPLARDNVRLLLNKHPDCQIVGEADNGDLALQLIEETDPDLVFLDIQMPEVTGLDVASELDAVSMPVIVFVTAYDQYAINAFEVSALDYLLKPYDDDRFEAALERARRRLTERRSGMFHDQVRELLEQYGAHEAGGAPRNAGRQEGERFLTRLVVKEAGRVYFVNVDDIRWIEAAGSYVRVHTGGPKRHLIRGSMTSMESRLDPDRFVRIHRSTIVNVDQIKELQPYFHGDYVVRLHDGTQLTLSRRKREAISRLLAGPG